MIAAEMPFPTGTSASDRQGLRASVNQISWYLRSRCASALAPRFSASLSRLSLRSSDLPTIRPSKGRPGAGSRRVRAPHDHGAGRRWYGARRRHYTLRRAEPPRPLPHGLPGDRPGHAGWCRGRRGGAGRARGRTASSSPPTSTTWCWPSATSTSAPPTQRRRSRWPTASRWCGPPASSGDQFRRRCPAPTWCGRSWSAPPRGGWRVFLLGAGPGVADEAARRLRERPGVDVVGTAAPFLTARGGDGAGAAEAAAAVRAVRPHLVLVAFGAPKQELWMSRNAGALAPARAPGGRGQRRLPGRASSPRAEVDLPGRAGVALAAPEGAAPALAALPGGRPGLRPHPWPAAAPQVEGRAGLRRMSHHRSAATTLASSGNRKAPMR